MSPPQIQVVYCGVRTLDKFFHKSMMPWIVADPSCNLQTLVSLRIVDGRYVTAYKAGSGDIMFEHSVDSMHRLYQKDCVFAYLYRLQESSPFVCHVFRADAADVLSRFVGALSDALGSPPTRSSMPQRSHRSKRASHPLLTPQASMRAYLHFEVLYIGKAYQSEGLATASLIDDAACKYLDYALDQHDDTSQARHAARLPSASSLEEGARRRIASTASNKSLPLALLPERVRIENALQEQASRNRRGGGGVVSFTNKAAVGLLSTQTGSGRPRPGGSRLGSYLEIDNETAPSNGNIAGALPLPPPFRLSSDTDGVELDESHDTAADEDDVFDVNNNCGAEDASASSFTLGAAATAAPKRAAPRCRAMLLMVGVNDLCVISPSTKRLLLVRPFSEICSISQGASNSDHFGFVCSTDVERKFVCYVLKAQSAALAFDIMQSLRSAFTAAAQSRNQAASPRRNPPEHQICHLCPMYQFSQLCIEVEGKEPSEAFEMIMRRVGQLNATYQEQIVNACKPLNVAHDASSAAFESSVEARNAALMMALHAVCCAAQSKHVHLSEQSKSSKQLEPEVTKFLSPIVGQKLKAAFDDTHFGFAPFLRCVQLKYELVNNTNICLSDDYTRQRRPRSSNATSSIDDNNNNASARISGLRERAKKSLATSLESLVKKFAREDDVEGIPDARRSTMNSSAESELNRHRPDSLSFLDDASSAGIDGQAFYCFDDDPEAALASDALLRLAAAAIGEREFATLELDGSGRYRPRRSTVSGETVLTNGLRGDGEDGNSPKLAALRMRRGYRTSVIAHDPALRHLCDIREYEQSTTTADAPSRSNQSTPKDRRRMSCRQMIFNRVMTPPLRMAQPASPRGTNELSENRRVSVANSIIFSPIDGPGENSPSFDSASIASAETVGSSEYYRGLWKKIIFDQILMTRIERKNKQAADEHCAESETRLKFAYEDVQPVPTGEASRTWRSFLEHPARQATRFDPAQLEDAIKLGVPREMRAEVWHFLAEQNLLVKARRASAEMIPPYSYAELLKQLTSHQHSILIDLGRTFPTHPYFERKFGAGQLALFNLLKAYSLLDTEVGYCQGLSFIAGLLLLHTDECNAFDLLVNLMYRLGIRKQYRPDMISLQIQMYQLSRLLHDRHRDLYEHFEAHEIPTLYAAPWFLTLFASTFPLGFVARALDMIFFFGSFDVVFKVALVLLGDHKELIKQCGSFEAINEFLKSTLPQMSIIQSERVFSQVLELDISRDLLAYEVEYHVLQDEMQSSPAPFSCEQPSTDDVMRLQTANKNLKRQNMELLEQLQQAHNRIALIEQSQQDAESRLHSANSSLDACKMKISSLESRVDTLDFERRSLLVSLERMRRQLEAAGLLPPASAMAGDLSTSFTPHSVDQSTPTDARHANSSDSGVSSVQTPDSLPSTLAESPFRKLPPRRAGKKEGDVGRRRAQE